MEGKHQYYSELSSREAVSDNVVEVVSTFNRILKAVPAAKRKDMTEWFLALIQQHHIMVTDKPSRLAYNPEVGKGTRNCELLTYNVSKLPIKLQSILTQYMMDCISSLKS